MAQTRRRKLTESDIRVETVLVAIAYAFTALNVLCFIAIVAGHAELMSWLVFFMDPSEFFVRFIVLALAVVWLYFGVVWHRDLRRHKRMLAEQAEGPGPASK